MGSVSRPAGPGGSIRSAAIMLACCALVIPVLAACLPSASETPVPAASSTAVPATETSTLTTTQLPEVLPITPEQDPPATLEILPAPPSTQTVEAMQLFFPTVIPAAGAEFRPPSYPIPWAPGAHDHFYFAWPIAATYPADPVWDYRYGAIFFGPDVIHTGVDLPAPQGTEVMAAGPGTVVWAGYGLYTGVQGNLEDPYGLAVAMRHDFGYKNQPLFTVYAHLFEIDVVTGQWLDTGDVLGNVGETGVTTGPHLHFEVRLGENDFWETRNPELWLAPSQGYGVLAGRVMSTHGTVLDSYIVGVKSLQTKQLWIQNTYNVLNVHRDEYYQENFVMGGLPAGLYEINIPFGSLNRKVIIEILPGQVNFFNFYGYSGYDFGSPVTPTPTP